MAVADALAASDPVPNAYGVLQRHGLLAGCDTGRREKRSPGIAACPFDTTAAAR